MVITLLLSLYEILADITESSDFSLEHDFPTVRFLIPISLVTQRD